MRVLFSALFLVSLFLAPGFSVAEAQERRSALPSTTGLRGGNEVPTPSQIAREKREMRALRDRAKVDMNRQGAGASEVDPKYLEEMDKIYNICAGSGLYSTFYDCKCQAVKFLDQRIKRGPNPPTENIMVDVNKECANIPDIAGYAYQKCMDKLSLLNYKEKSLAPFCECAANKYAKGYAKDPRLSSVHLQGLQKSAYRECGFSDLR